MRPSTKRGWDSLRALLPALLLVPVTAALNSTSLAAVLAPAGGGSFELSDLAGITGEAQDYGTLALTILTNASHALSQSALVLDRASCSGALSEVDPP